MARSNPIRWWGETPSNPDWFQVSQGSTESHPTVQTKCREGGFWKRD